MRLPLYQVDAFTSRRFGGNPAAVCPLPEWLPDALLQDIAAENNLSETAYLVGGAGRYALRWFTPTVEMPLCGHATLASGYVVLHELEPALTEVRFATASGELTVARHAEGLAMALPRRDPAAAPDERRAAVERALGVAVAALLQSGRVLFAVLADEAAARDVRPDIDAVVALGSDLCVTAPGSDSDFVSRFFAPLHGIAEDPVTGSTHCVLTPYWAERLDKNSLTAKQVSRRGGELRCLLEASAVTLVGDVQPYLFGHIEV
jgi:PhzF family phenazine biosynthesis protein